MIRCSQIIAVSVHKIIGASGREEDKTNYRGTACACLLKNLPIAIKRNSKKMFLLNRVNTSMPVCLFAAIHAVWFDAITDYIAVTG